MSAEPRRDAVPRHGFVGGARLCARCGLSLINPVHGYDPYERGPLAGMRAPVERGRAAGETVACHGAARPDPAAAAGGTSAPAARAPTSSVRASGPTR